MSKLENFKLNFYIFIKIILNFDKIKPFILTRFCWKSIRFHKNANLYRTYLSQNEFHSILY